MGDEQHRHAVFRLEIGEQLQDLRLHGDVERGGRLVGDEQVRPVGERHGDHHALALAAGKLMRIGAETRGRIDDADLGQKRDHLRARRSRAAAMQGDDLADLPLDRMQRIERGHRLLEDHRDAGAAHGRAIRASDIFRTSLPSNKISPEGWLAAG